MNTNPSIYKLSSEYKFLDIEQNVIVQAVLNAFDVQESEMAKKDGDCPVNETLIIDTLNARNFDKQHIDAILTKMASFKHPMTTIKIKLYEKKQDYVEAFELHFSNPQLKKRVFNWIEVTL